MLELRAEEAILCVGGPAAEVEGSAVGSVCDVLVEADDAAICSVGDAAAKFEGVAVFSDTDMEVEIERVFIAEKLLVTVGIW